MHTHTHFCRSTSTLDPIANNSTIFDYDFECPIDQDEDESEKDCDIPGELARLLLQEEKAIQPHEESIEVINLGTDQIRKKSGSALIWKVVLKAVWFRCCTIMWKYLLGRMKICLGWIPILWFIVCLRRKTDLQLNKKSVA